MSTAIYAVTGPTCQYCINKVTDTIRSLSGVTDVAMDLSARGQSPLIVTSGAKLGADAVRDALENAGFGLLAPSGQDVGGRGTARPPVPALPIGLVNE